MKTRSELPSQADSQPIKAAKLESQEPPKVLILPVYAGKDALIITLAHPRTSAPTRYYFCPETGIYEFTRIAALNSSHRSWLISASSKNQEAELRPSAQEGSDGETIEDTAPDENRGIYDNDSCRSISNGYVCKSAELLVATSTDPLFLLLPILDPNSSSTKSDTSKRLFLSIDDLLEQLCAISKHVTCLIKHTPTRQVIEKRMEVVCDTVDAANEKMYRLNNQKLLKEMLFKAEAMASSGLPPSMEEKFVRKALEVPIMGVKRQESSVVESSEPAVDETLQTGFPTPESMDSQSSISTSVTTPSELSLGADTTILVDPIAPDTPQEIIVLLRLRTALIYLLSTYVPASLSKLLTTLLSLTSPVDFTPLDTHLANLASLRTQALASRDFNMKRGFEDDEAVESRAEKKRKKEEEEKRKKAGESRAVRDLKKVDITGMRKMSDFFGKAVGKKTKCDHC
ncbi:hypothetical protein MMC06_002542 [Schaereria dolodes]|nr:hypothetical protein [Schaereria dolodes]